MGGIVGPGREEAARFLERVAARFPRIARLIRELGEQPKPVNLRMREEELIAAAHEAAVRLAEAAEEVATVMPEVGREAVETAIRVLEALAARGRRLIESGKLSSDDVKRVQVIVRDAEELAGCLRRALESGRFTCTLLR